MDYKRRTWVKAAGASLLVPMGLTACGGGSGRGAGSWLPPVGADTKNSGRASDGRSFVVVWNDELLDAVRRTNMGPPIVARATAILNSALYDTWSRYDAKALPSLATTLSKRNAAERTTEQITKALAFAGWRALRALFPTEVTKFDSVLADFGFVSTDSAKVTDPAARGVETADAVLAARVNDGSNVANAYADNSGFTTSQPPMDVSVSGLPAGTDPSRWQPLIVPVAGGGKKTQKYLVPHWGNVQPFALSSGAALRALADQHYKMPGSNAALAEIEEVLGFYQSLSDQHKVIAEYWANGPKTETPPGHWCLFARWVSERDRLDIEHEVKLYFMLGQALLDASIAAWDYKRNRMAARPITQIRANWAGKKVGSWQHGVGNVTVDGAEWMPFQAFDFVTPPFPDHISGHSTFSAAGAEIMSLATGSDNFGATQSFEPGSLQIESSVPAQTVELGWSSFSAAAEEAGLSRLYGGIHVRSAHLGGASVGREVARRVHAKSQLLFAGTSA